MANKNSYWKYKNKSKKKVEEVDNFDYTTIYSIQQLSKSINELDLSDLTKELLTKNKIITCADLIKRNEHDMYKVQGLNKKILNEIIKALAAVNMSFKDSDKKAKELDLDVQKNKPQETKKSKFGIAEKVESKQAKIETKQNESNLSSENNDSNELRKVMKGGKWGYMLSNKIVIPTMYDEIFSFKEGLASVELDEKCGYIDMDNNIIIPLDYDIAMSFSEGLAMVSKGEKCGYINKNNEVIIPFDYDAATPFEDGEAKVKKDGKWATITPDNKLTWI